LTLGRWRRCERRPHRRLDEAPKDRPVTPQDIHATIYVALGVDPSIKFLNHSGRPVPAIDNG
jgi:hypothetical protein